LLQIIKENEEICEVDIWILKLDIIY
jgi:hypothetical protein